jgi:hypothetical protein
VVGFPAGINELAISREVDSKRQNGKKNDVKHYRKRFYEMCSYLCLRTGRVTFTASSSSLNKRLWRDVVGLRIRLLAMDLAVAVRMQQLPVAESELPP